jgi:hypothetical protein
MIGHPSGDKPLMMDVRQSGSGPDHLVAASSPAKPASTQGAGYEGVFLAHFPLCRVKGGCERFRWLAL